LKDLKYTDDSFIHVSLILSGVEIPEDGSTPSILNKLKVFCQTLFHSSRGSSLHLIFLTDDNSVRHIKPVLINEIGRSLSETAISIYRTDSFGPSGWQFPRKLKIEFARISRFSEKYAEEIEDMRKYFGVTFAPNTTKVGADGVTYILENFKYRKDLFYIAPFYPLEFPKQIKLLICLDVDLEFSTDLRELLDEAEKMSEREMIAVGPDLSPHYYEMTVHHRIKYPDSNVGMVGKMQGLNTGVVVYNLHKMRQSQTLKEFINKENYHRVVNKYFFYGGVGDQDLFTMMSWEFPEMFYSLPCQYNVQTFIDDSMSKETVKLFSKYRSCKPKTKILHRNGSI